MRPLDPAVRAHLAPARRPLAVLFGAGLVQTGLLVAQAFVISGVVVALVDGRPVRQWAVATAVVLATRALVSLLGDAAAARAAARVGHALRSRLLDTLLVERSRTSGPTRPVGAVVVLATRGVSETEPYLTRYLPALVLAVALPPVVVVAIATQDLMSALIVVLTLPLVPLFAVLVGLRTRDRAERQWRQLSVLASHFMDVVKGLPTLVAFRRADHQTSTIRTITHRYRRASMATLRLAFASSAVLELVATLSVALVAVTVGVRLASGSLDLGTALVVLLLAPEAYWPLRRVGAEFHAAAQGSAAFAEADLLLNSDPAEDETTAPEPTGHGLPDDPMRVAAEEVSLTRPGSPTPALPPVSFTALGPGLVVVTGPSGAGKSTLLDVLRGRLTPSSGTIRVGGRDLADVDRDAWARLVAWLPQRPCFIRGSVADNLRLGRRHATEAELWAALRVVGLGSLVSGLTGGLQAEVAEDGGNFSAGERARLALARVVVAQRPVVLLDEPTAHLDEESEHLVVAAIRALSRSALVVAVAHRPMLARSADAIVALPGATSQVVKPDALSPTIDLTEPPRSQENPVRSIVPTPTPDAEDRPARGRLRGWTSVALGSLASLAGIALTATAGWLIVRASAQPPVLVLMVAIVGVRTFGIARPVLRYAERLVSHDAALRMLASRRAEVFAALVPLTPGRLGARRGDVLATVVEDVEALVDRRLRAWLPIMTGVVTGLTTAVVAGLLLPAAGVIDALLVFAVGGGVLLGTRAWVARPDAAAVDERARLGEDITELAEGAEEIVAWGATSTARKAIDERSRRTQANAMSSGVRAGVGRTVTMLGVAAAVAATALAVDGPVGDGSLSPATGALLLLVPLALGEVLVPVADAAVAEVRSRRSMTRLDALLDQTPTVQDPGYPQSLPVGPQSLVLTGATTGWGDAPAFDPVDVHLEPGSRVGVVGPSGSGKSTLAGMLVRFLDPMHGSVTYGQHPLATAPLDDVRRTVGLVDDDPHLFATTLVENVRLACPGASDAAVERALRAVSLGRWLDELPDGLHTWIGEGHRDVSAGERARIALARVLLADTRVVVLDEPTAHLDAATAADVMRTLLDATRGRALVLVTHRPEGLDEVDAVVTLQPWQGVPHRYLVGLPGTTTPG